MKKLFAFAALLLGLSLSGNAQEKKSWDFTLGLSDETVANLNADQTNWAANGTDANGVTNNWKNHTKHTASDPWKANDVEIAELAGLLIDIGSNGDNSLHLAQEKLRLTRNNTTITFPKLTNGQTVTIVGRSANGDAGGSVAHRYIEPVQSYLVLTQGETTDGKCSFVGNKVAGSLGTYSFTWTVQTSEAEPVDVQFKLPSAGIDFTLFQIDEGDAPKKSKVAFFYGGDGDAVLPAILKANENIELTEIDVATIPTGWIEASSFADKLRSENDVLVISPSVPTDNAAGDMAREALPWMPVLNFNADIVQAWGYGLATNIYGLVKIKSTKSNLFKNVALEETEEGSVLVLSNSGFDATSKALRLGEYFQGDEILAVGTDEDAPVAIHTHNINHNGYIYFPYVTDFTESAIQAIYNAINILSNSKAEATEAPAPIITRAYKNLKTTVTITPARVLPKTRIFYTTDGSEPTVLATEYTGPFDVETACTVKAIALAEGYKNSLTASFDVKVKAQPNTPAVSVAMADGQTTVTLSCDTEGTEVWYNFDASTDTTKSSKYVEPFTIKMPATMTAFAVDTLEKGDEVWSEAVTQRILVRNPRVVIDVAGHFKATKWDNVDNGGGIFSWGKSAQSMYVPGTGEEVVKTDENGDEIIVIENAEIVEGETRDEPGDDPQWMVTSLGQSVLWQNLTAKTDQIGTNDGGYYPSVAEDIDPLFPITNYDIQFYKIFAGETANATIQSKVKYKAPLDVVTIANMQGGPLAVQVSADGKEWQTVGDEIAKTGFSRMWKKYINSYEGTDEVYVRLAQFSGDMSAKVFDIYVANAGEKSKALLEEINAELAGIEEVKQGMTNAAQGIYSLGGIRQGKLHRGLNIVVAADGTVRKVLVK